VTGDRALGELVDGREIQEWEGDRFRHQDVATQLADLAATVTTPANVALYGPWGSGKTSVANLLRERFQQKDFIDQHGKVKFVRFDAFKYAEIPLRRHFLSQMAIELLPTKAADEFRRDLYHSTSRADIDFSALDVWRALRVFLGLLAAVLLIAVVLAATVAAVVTTFADAPDPGFWVRTRTYSAWVVTLSFAPAAVLGGLFAIAGKVLPVTRHRDIPSTDEEFERQFRDLLSDSEANRLVVFVDELDRCPADRVVDVLDTVRTFLDVEETVFIVAADQHVLEQALTDRVKQITPPNPTNPYYSSGSAYLDKVFHYQMSLPALLPGRITRYAVQLVEGRPGVWSNPSVNVPWVVSVLIPTHVRSPRRVKTLLNNYALAFRLAHRRYQEGHLSSDPGDRALELAKLVTLRTEFPSFARELTLSRRLPELFLLLAENTRAEPPPEVSIEVWEKAAAFADGDLTVDEMLDHRNSSDGVGELDDEEVTVDDAVDSAASHKTRAALRQQLHHYLLKTRHIPSPARDLIFLEGQGHLFDLDESLVEEIEDAAVGGRSFEVVAIVDEQEPAVQANVIRLLAQRTREAFPGVEGQNLVGVLLAVAANRSNEVLETCADEAIDAVNAHSDHGDLTEENLSGAFLLGLRSNREGSDELVNYVLARNEATTHPDLGRLILEHAGQLSDDHLKRVADVGALHLLDENTARHTVTTIDSLPNAATLLGHARVAVSRILESAIELDDSAADDDAEKEASRALERLGDSLTEALEQCLEIGADEIASCLLLSAFQADHSDYWTLAGRYLPDIAETPLTSGVHAAVLKRSAEVTPEVATSWLESLPDGFAHTMESRQAATDTVRMLWKHRTQLGDEYTSHDQQFQSAMTELDRVQAPLAGADRTGLVAELDVDLGAAPADAPQAKQLSITLNQLRRFVEIQLLPAGPASDLVVKRLVATLNDQQTPPQVANDKEFQSFAARWSLWTSRYCSSEATTSLLTAITDCSWLPTPKRESLALRVASTAHSVHKNVQSPFDSRTVRQLAEAHGVAIQHGIASWILTFASEPQSAYQACESLIRASHYSVLSSAIRECAARFGPDERLELARLELASSSRSRLSIDFLRDTQFHDADDIAGADLIVAAYGQSGTNNDRRLDLLDAWGVLQPTSQTARHRLIDNVTLPMLKDGGKQALIHVKSRIALIANPTGRKNALRDALRSAAGGRDADKRLESLMLDHRIRVQRSKGPFRWGKEEVDER